MTSKNVNRKCPNCGTTNIYHVEDSIWTNTTCPKCGFNFFVTLKESQKESQR